MIQVFSPKRFIQTTILVKYDLKPDNSPTCRHWPITNKNYKLGCVFPMVVVPINKAIILPHAEFGRNDLSVQKFSVEYFNRIFSSRNFQLNFYLVFCQIFMFWRGWKLFLVKNGRSKFIQEGGLSWLVQKLHKIAWHNHPKLDYQNQS